MPYYSYRDYLKAGYQWWELPHGMKADYLYSRHLNQMGYYHNTTKCPICRGYLDDIASCLNGARTTIAPKPRCPEHGHELDENGDCYICILRNLRHQKTTLSKRQLNLAPE